MVGFDYPNEFTFQAEGIGFGIVGVFIVIYLLALLVSLVFSVATYVLHSLGLYTIAKHRGIHHSWLAWLPVGNLWVLGSVSDQYQYVVKGKIKNRRKTMMGLSVAIVALYIVWLVCRMVSLFGASLILGAISVLGVVALLALVVWLTVYQYLVYYDLYRSCEPDNGTLFLVLSILFAVAIPFFVFACRKKDLGMPPRKQPAQPVIVPTVEPVVESTTDPVAEGFAQPEEFEEE